MNGHYHMVTLMTHKFLPAFIFTFFLQIQPYLSASSAFHLPHHHHHNSINNTVSGINLPYKVLYANGMNETTLPECGTFSVCSKIDTYDKPWMEKQCRCPQHTGECSSSTLSNDGHTITDKTRHYKLCEPVRKLPKCRYFRDITWTLVTKGDNLTQQIVHCVCPKDAVAYMIKRQAYTTEDNQVGFKYSFACSPQSRVLCQRKEPCRLFTVKRRTSVTEVNTSALCQCPRGFQCPSHHTDPGVIAGKFYPENMLRTFSGYCV